MSPSPNKQTYKHFNLKYPLPFVAHVEINRPQKMNAFIQVMFLELRTVFDYLSHDPSTRVVILSGAGPKAFTAGLDIVAASQGTILGSSSPSIESKDGARMATKMRRHIDELQHSIAAIERCEKPVVAALHGYTLGLGIDIAVCADVRICAAETQFAVKEVDIGIAADVGTLSRLAKVVGNGSWIKDICLSGRLFGAEEASRAGLVSWVAKEAPNGGKDAVIKEALRWAAIVAEKSPVAVQGTKGLINWSRDHGVQDGLRYTSIWNSAMLQTADVGAAMGAGIRKTKPRFEKL